MFSSFLDPLAIRCFRKMPKGNKEPQRTKYVKHKFPPNIHLLLIDLVFMSEFTIIQDLEDDGSIGASFGDAKFLSSNQQPRELFLSSDASALVEHTKKVLVIEDDEVIHLQVHYFSLDFPFFCLFCFSTMDNWLNFDEWVCVLHTYHW